MAQERARGVRPRSYPRPREKEPEVADEAAAEDEEHEGKMESAHQWTPTKPGGPGERGDTSGASDLDAMGLDKRRQVVGQSYGPSVARQLTVYGVFLGIIAAFAIGFYLLARELDQPPDRNPDEAPWSAPRAPQIPPQPLE